MVVIGNHLVRLGFRISKETRIKHGRSVGLGKLGLKMRLECGVLCVWYPPWGVSLPGGSHLEYKNKDAPTEKFPRSFVRPLQGQSLSHNLMRS